MSPLCVTVEEEHSKKDFNHGMIDCFVLLPLDLATVKDVARVINIHPKRSNGVEEEGQRQS